MARRKARLTRNEIIQVATQMFLEKGYSNTSIKAISDELDISTGNLTFYFPTKEHLLAQLVEMLCAFQWKLMERVIGEGESSLMAVCLELTSMASVCEENEIIKDFYLAAYKHELSLELIRQSDMRRAKMVFGEYCTDWVDEHFAVAENIVSGIEYATLMTTDSSIPLDARIAGALNMIMQTYAVPEEVRKQKIKKVLSMNYQKIGRDILDDFMEYIKDVNEKAVEE